MNHKIREMWVVITEDRQKAAVLGVLLLVLAGLVVKYLFAGVGPRGTQAAVDKSTSPSSATDVGQSAITRTMAALGAGQSTRVISLAPTPRLSRNLFALDASFFPPPAQMEPAKGPQRSTHEPVIEATPENADVLRAREAARIQDEAKSLRLRSIVLGQAPNAVIEVGRGERRVVRVGQDINGFRLVSVEPGSVLLEKETVRVRLSLARPER